MVGFVYVLGAMGRNGVARSYVGWTTDLDRRLRQHNSMAAGGAKSTLPWRWELLYAEKFPERKAAMSREVFLKRERGFRKSLLAGYFEIT